MIRDRLAITLLFWMTFWPGARPVPPENAQEPGAVFRSDVRLVEVHATITDSKGRFLNGLRSEQFEVRDNGEVQPIAAFEPETAGFTCALLLDRTGSMLTSLPSLKSAVLRLIDAFRENDIFAVYTFNTALRRIHDLSHDKAGAKQVVLRTLADGDTALFDSLSAVTVDLAAQKGKKVIIVFTDGDDNSSYLGATTVVQRSKTLGIPIYAVAQGEALKNAALLRLLGEIGHSTGGAAYGVRKASEMEGVFATITSNIQHAYMLAYVAPPADDMRWRTIKVTVSGVKGARIRAREGYYPK